jgi:hypothetical protein
MTVIEDEKPRECDGRIATFFYAWIRMALFTLSMSFVIWLAYYGTGVVLEVVR